MIRRDVSDAVLAALTAAGAANSPPWQVYDGTVPVQPTTPYAVLYPLAGGESYGPFFTAPDADAELIYQVTSVGSSREQAEWLGDKVFDVMLGRDTGGAFLTEITLSVYRVADRLLEQRGSVTVEGEPPFLLFNAVDQYRVCVTPA